MYERDLIDRRLCTDDSRHSSGKLVATTESAGKMIWGVFGW